MAWDARLALTPAAPVSPRMRLGKLDPQRDLLLDIVAVFLSADSCNNLLVSPITLFWKNNATNGNNTKTETTNPGSTGSFAFKCVFG